MRDLRELDGMRVPHPFFPKGAHDPATSGAFEVQTTGRKFFARDCGRVPLRKKVEHISISHKNQKIYPTWDEMCQIKDLFFLPEEECVQVFPRKSEHVNITPNCFHLWRPVDGLGF